MEGAKKIIAFLEEAGYAAYIIGGAVRDSLLGKEPGDIDVVTNAKPEEVIALAEKQEIPCSSLVGKAFGIVVLALPEGQYEVATYRKERYGADCHKPEWVEYTDSLEADVRRRDFTINGMAMDKAGRIYDFVEGQKDLKRKLIRTIGKAEDRFHEDGLRMFRACRFASQLDFQVAKEVMEGIKASLFRVEGLSQERILIELEKILLSKTPARGLDVLVQSGLGAQKCKIMEKEEVHLVDILPELSHLVGLPQMKEFHAFDGWYHTLAVVQASVPDLTVRWAALFHDVAKGLPGIRSEENNRLTDHGHDQLGASMAEEILLRFRYKKAFASRVAWLVKNHMRFHFFAHHEDADAFKWLRQEARSGLFRNAAEMKEAFWQLQELCVADVIGCGKEYSSTEGTKSFGEYMQELCKTFPVHTRDLAYEDSLITLCKDKTGEILQHLLERVQNRQLVNTPEALLDAAQRRLNRLEQG